MNLIRISTVIVLSLSVLASAPTLAATGAGKVVYAFGQVQAIDATGASRGLSRGAPFGPGDTIVTRRGRAQLRFSDGGFAALQPNTEYQIEDYHYSGKADGKERSFLNLVRGSVRLVTGIIGRSTKKNFRLRTAVATIGIRGTAGKVSHCDANCGELGPGTAMAGYDGIWDLNSGSYSGPVQAGQATFCDGSACFDLPGFGQRAQTDQPRDELDETLDDNDERVADGEVEKRFQDGVQSDAEGIQCSINGSCDSNILVALNQIGASALDSHGMYGETEAYDNTAVVFNNGVPIGGVSVNSSNDDASDLGIGFITVDAAALRQAFTDFADPAVAALGLKVLDSIPLSQLQDLASMPASVADEDYALTSDGLLLHGRWQDGYIMDGEADVNGENVFTELRKLTGYQSEHFLFGADPGVLPSSGIATYKFTGGTFSTAVDGSSIGLGTTAGSLAFDFLSGSGTLEMDVEHGAKMFDVFASLQLQNGRFFRETSAYASYGPDSYNVTVDGFFAEPGTEAPLAAGLAYAIETPVHIIGTAGFGLTEVSTLSAPVPVDGSWVGWTSNYLSFGSLNSEAFDFLVDGSSNTASATNGVITEFSSDFHAGVCAPPCTFNSNGESPIIDQTGVNNVTSLPELGIAWGRFAPNASISLSHANLGGTHTLNGSSHVVLAQVPSDINTLPLLGSNQEATYNTIIGGTEARISFQTLGVQQNEVAVNMNTAEIVVTFDTGTISGNFQGTFNDGTGPNNGSIALSDSGAFNRLDGLHSVGGSTGLVTSGNISNGPNCSGGCSMFWHTHLVTVGADAPTVAAGVVQGNSSFPGVNFSWGYVLQDSDGLGAPGS